MLEDKTTERAMAIRKAYHQLEEAYHTASWSIEEDALAFLTDAALVGRLVMSHENRWPSESEEQLPHKIGESFWWLIVLAKRMDIDPHQALDTFLKEKEALLLNKKSD